MSCDDKEGKETVGGADEISYNRQMMLRRRQGVLKDVKNRWRLKLGQLVLRTFDRVQGVDSRLGFVHCFRNSSMYTTRCSANSD